MLVEYKLVKEYIGMIVPAFIEDGGYFNDPDNYTFVGTVLPESDREYYVPDSLLYLSKEELLTRVLDIHSRYPMSKMVETESVLMTEEEVEEMVNQWCDERGE